MPLPAPPANLQDLEKLRYTYMNFDLYLAWIPIDSQLFFMRSTRASGWTEHLDQRVGHYPQNPGHPPGPIAPAWTAPRLPQCHLGPHRVAFVGETCTFDASNSQGIGPAWGGLNDWQRSSGYNITWYVDGVQVNQGVWQIHWTPTAGIHTVGCQIATKPEYGSYSHTATRYVYVAQNRDELARKFPLTGVSSLSGSMDGGGFRLQVKLSDTGDLYPGTGIVLLYAECRYGDGSDEGNGVTAIPGLLTDPAYPARYPPSILFSGYADESSFLFDPRHRELTLTARTAESILERLQSEFTPFTSTTGYGHVDPLLTIPDAIWHMLQSHSNFLDYHDFELYFNWNEHVIPSWAFEKGSAWDSVKSGAENEFMKVYCTPHGALRLHPDIQLLSPTDRQSLCQNYFPTLNQPTADIYGLDNGAVTQTTTVNNVPVLIRNSVRSSDLVPLDITPTVRTAPVSDWVQVVATPGTTGGYLFVCTYPPSPTVDVDTAIAKIFEKRGTIYQELVAKFEDSGWNAVPRRMAVLAWMAFSTSAEGRNPLDIGHPEGDYYYLKPDGTFADYSLPPSPEGQSAPRLVNSSYLSAIPRYVEGVVYFPLQSPKDDSSNVGGGYPESCQTRNNNNILAFARSLGWIENEPPTTSYRPWKVVQGKFVGATPAVYNRIKTVCQRLWDADQDLTPAAELHIPMCPGLGLGYQFARYAPPGAPLYNGPDTWIVLGLQHDFDLEARTWITTLDIGHYPRHLDPSDDLIYLAPRPLGVAAPDSASAALPRSANPLATVSAPAWWPLPDWPPVGGGLFPGANPDGQTPGQELTSLPSGLGWLPPDTGSFPPIRPDWWPESWVWPDRLASVPDPLPDWWPAGLPHPAAYGSAQVVPPGFPEPVRGDGQIGWNDDLPTDRPDWWCYHWEWPPMDTPWNHASRGVAEAIASLDVVWGSSDTSPVPPRQTTSAGATANPEPIAQLAGVAGFTPQSYLDSGMSTQLSLLLRGDASTAASGSWPQFEVRIEGIVHGVLETIDDLISIPMTYVYNPATRLQDTFYVDLVWTNPTAGGQLWLHALAWGSLPVTCVDAWRTPTEALHGYYASGGGETEFMSDEYNALITTGQVPAKDGVRIQLDLYSLYEGARGLKMPRTTDNQRAANLNVNTAAQAGVMSVQSSAPGGGTPPFVFKYDGGAGDGYGAQGYLPTPSGVHPGQAWSLDWQGLYAVPVTGAGDYEFEVISNGASAAIEVDDQIVLALVNPDVVGPASRSGCVDDDGELHGTTWHLRPGWHHFRIVFAANGQDSDHQILRVQWRPAGGTWADLDSSRFEVPLWQ